VPQIHLLLSHEPSIDQGKQIFSLQFGFLLFLGRVGMRRRWLRRLWGRSLCFTAGPLLPRTCLRALGQRRLHPPSAGCFHSHSLGGYAGGGRRRHAWISPLAQWQW
jgi:hypothetical protein